jgi:hypothetical protein
MLPNLVVHVFLLAVTFVMASKNYENFEGCLEGYIALHPPINSEGRLRCYTCQLSKNRRTGHCLSAGAPISGFLVTC